MEGWKKFSWLLSWAGAVTSSQVIHSFLWISGIVLVLKSLSRSGIPRSVSSTSVSWLGVRLGFGIKMVTSSILPRANVFLVCMFPASLYVSCFPGFLGFLRTKGSGTDNLCWGSDRGIGKAVKFGAILVPSGVCEWHKNTRAGRCLEGRLSYLSRRHWYSQPSGLFPFL